MNYDDPANEWIPCPVCYGEGLIIDSESTPKDYVTCQFCAGTGTVQEALWDED